MHPPGHNVELQNVPPTPEDENNASDYEEDSPAEPSFTATIPLPLAPAGSPGIDLVDFIVAQQTMTENRIQREEEAAGIHMTDVAVDPNQEDSTKNLTGKEEITKISYLTLLGRYSTRVDIFLMLIGLIAATGAGVVLPLMTIIFGNFTNEFSNPTEKFMDTINTMTLYFVYLGVGMFATTYIYMSTWLYTGENISHAIREAYLRATLKQNIAYFDQAGSGGGSVSTRIITDTQLVQDGISEKVPMFFMNGATFVTGFAVAFTHSWKLTLVLMCCIPLIGGAAMVIGLLTGKYTRGGLTAYATAGNVAEEAFASIRTVSAFTASEKLAKAYRTLLGKAETNGIKKQVVLGAGFGVIQLTIYSTYALAFYYGGKLVRSGEVQVGDVMVVFFSILIGAFALAGTSSEVSAFSFAVGAGSGLFAAIDRVPEIDSDSKEGYRPDAIVGRIDVKDVRFRYPSRPDVVVLYGMTLSIPAGTTCALVGSSGSGKSTIVSLLERFYNPESGTISVDGIDVTTINVNYLRRQIGYVTQEPTLFKGALWANVADGMIGTPEEAYPKEKKMNKIIEACKFANAHDFIMALPLGYDTLIGERGLLLSGGQKQRIAIARAIVKDPKILLLDEATSALDTESEKIVQEALDRAAKGRTTIVIAHRLSTIRNADQIVVMDQGKIIETGTHDSLVQIQDGFYRRLVEAQQISAEKDAANPNGEASSTPPKYETHKSMGRTKSIRSVRSARSRKSATYSRKGSKGFVGQKFIWTGDNVKRKVKDFFSLGDDFKTFKRTVALNKSESPMIFGGVCGAILTGITQPVFAVLFGYIISSLMGPASETDFWSLMFLLIGLVNFFSVFTKFSLFGISGEKLTTRLRDMSFRQIVRQDIGWFDLEHNSVGALTSNLSNRAQEVQNFSGQIVGNLLELLSSIVGAAIVALVTGWKLGLVVMATLPLLILANKFRMDLIRKGNTATKVFYEHSAQVACEAVGSMRTIAALTKEKEVLSRYHKDLEEPLRIGHRNAYFNTIIYAASQTITFLMNALTFWYGGTLIDQNELDLKSFFTIFMAVTFASQSAGRVFSMMPDVGKAKDSAAEILALLDRVPPIDAWSKEGKVMPKESIAGLVEFRDVHFNYPNRPGIKVLQGLNLTIQPGQFVALVGASGCGKSTTVGLLTRFYDIASGSLTVDGVHVNSMNIQSLRDMISLVGQEPNLYDLTIKDNIWFGLPSKPSDEDIIQAAKDANIHEFILGLPDGYDTNLGGKGAQLSGGQKQRIAIARALIRKPKILLLDEATSALDATSEKVVQAALDNAAKGRTTISIAHRLSTIKNADIIYVFAKGLVAESGTHEQLIAHQGLYYQLVLQQDLSGH